MPSEMKVNKISPASGTAITLGDSGDTFTVPSGAAITNSGTATGFGGGKVLQVVYVTKSDTFLSSSSSYVDITGLTVDITPSATSSKVYAVMNIATRHRAAGMNPSFKLLRDSTTIAVGSDFYHPSGSGVSGNVTISVVDSPSSTSTLTYKAQTEPSKDSTTELDLNRDYDNNLNGISTIVLMEIGA